MLYSTDAAGDYGLLCFCGISQVFVFKAINIYERMDCYDSK